MGQNRLITAIFFNHHCFKLSHLDLMTVASNKLSPEILVVFMESIALFKKNNEITDRLYFFQVILSKWVFILIAVSHGTWPRWD